jgi:hypothetical protein
MKERPAFFIYVLFIIIIIIIIIIIMIKWGFVNFRKFLKHVSSEFVVVTIMLNGFGYVQSESFSLLLSLYLTIISG